MNWKIFRSILPLVALVFFVYYTKSLNPNYAEIEPINVSDIILLIEHIVSINTFNNSQKILLADANQDGIINVADVVFNVNIIFE